MGWACYTCRMLIEELKDLIVQALRDVEQERRVARQRVIKRWVTRVLLAYVFVRIMDFVIGIPEYRAWDISSVLTAVMIVLTDWVLRDVVLPKTTPDERVRRVAEDLDRKIRSAIEQERLSAESTKNRN